MAYLVDKEHDILQFKGITYLLPPKTDLRNDLSRRVWDRAEEINCGLHLVIYLGFEFYCGACEYNKFSQAKHGTAISPDSIESCVYLAPEDGPHWLSFFPRIVDGKEIGFLARRDSCVITDTLIQASVLEGILESYKISDPGIGILRFPTEKEAKVGSDAEREAILLYETLRRQS